MILDKLGRDSRNPYYNPLDGGNTKCYNCNHEE